MIIKATIRLQACTTKIERYGFVQRNRPSHGIAKGKISLWEVRGASWAGIRRTLKTFGVMGYSACSPATVLAHSKDIGTVYAGLRRLDHSNTAIACASCGATHVDVIQAARFLEITVDPICCEVSL